MDTIAAELERLIEDHFPRLNKLEEAEFALKLAPSKWSKKEITGHLIDSAQANLRRFVVGRYDNAPLIIYDQDQWVTINDYQHQPSKELIMLWYLLNKQIVVVLRNTPVEGEERNVKTPELRSIRWLAADYCKHLAHHIHQVLSLEPVAYP